MALSHVDNTEYNFLLANVNCSTLVLHKKGHVDTEYPTVKSRQKTFGTAVAIDCIVMDCRISLSEEPNSD